MNTEHEAQVPDEPDTDHSVGRPGEGPTPDEELEAARGYAEPLPADEDPENLEEDEDELPPPFSGPL
ncbi:hypothetical protein ACFWZT_15070 [Streptomyces alboflavus]|uniref:hypothetical protein n=1 Tax=Streptomyces alboflavus TaxID=67267 RepID=UPI0036A623E7